MEIFILHPRESLHVLQSSIQLGFIPSLIFIYVSVSIVQATAQFDGFLGGTLYAYHLLRIFIQFLAIPIRFYLYRESRRLIKLQDGAQLNAGVLELLGSWPWKWYTSLGEVMSIFIGGGVLLALYSGWGDIEDEKLLGNVYMHLAQTVFQTGYVLVTMYRFGAILQEGDGLQHLREAQGISSANELAEVSRLCKFSQLEAEQQKTCQETSCAVCYGHYEDDQPVRELPCSHVYHAECIDSWLKSKALCPTCHHDVKKPYAKTTSIGTSSPLQSSQSSPALPQSQCPAQPSKMSGTSLPVSDSTPQTIQESVVMTHVTESKTPEDADSNSNVVVSRRAVRTFVDPEMDANSPSSYEMTAHALVSPTTPALPSSSAHPEMDVSAMIRA